MVSAKHGSESKKARVKAELTPCLTLEQVTSSTARTGTEFNSTEDTTNENAYATYQN